MKYIWKRGACLTAPVCAALAFFSPNAEARPVSSAGTWSVASENTANGNHQQIHYSLSRRFALGVAYHYDGWVAPNYDDVLGNLGVLVWRKNSREFQANSFLQLAGGVGVGTDLTPVLHGTWGIDAESRRLFGQLAAHGHLRDWELSDSRILGKAGIAVFEADYDELSPWLMVQAHASPSGDSPFEVRPMLRLMYRNLQMELGSSHRGNWYIHFNADL